MPSKGEGLYQQHYLSETANGAGQGTTILSKQFTNEGQISYIKIFGPDAQDYNVVVKEHGAPAGETVFTLAGNSNYNVGDFSEPLDEFGAVKEIAIVTASSLSGSNYGINVRIDELTG